MHKLNNKIIYILIIIIFVIGIYYLFFTDKDYIENNPELNTTNLQEENIKDKNSLSNTEDKSKIKIYITGQIKNEGVYEVKENSRITDIIQEAGGLTDDANIDSLNLAYRVEDGMKIYIPKKGEKENEIQDDTNIYVTNKNNTTDKISENNKINSKNQKININTATQTELETLPGIGVSTALKIINYRKENGKFKSIEDIKKVSGIGDSKYEKIKTLIKV